MSQAIIKTATLKQYTWNLFSLSKYIYLFNKIPCTFAMRTWSFPASPAADPPTELLRFIWDWPPLTMIPCSLRRHSWDVRWLVAATWNATMYTASISQRPPLPSGVHSIISRQFVFIIYGTLFPSFLEYFFQSVYSNIMSVNLGGRGNTLSVCESLGRNMWLQETKHITRILSSNCSSHRLCEHLVLRRLG